MKEEVFGMSLKGFKTEYNRYTQNTGKGDLCGEGGSIEDLALRLKEAHRWSVRSRCFKRED